MVIGCFGCLLVVDGGGGGGSGGTARVVVVDCMCVCAFAVSLTMGAIMEQREGAGEVCLFPFASLPVCVYVCVFVCMCSSIYICACLRVFVYILLPQSIAG